MCSSQWRMPVLQNYDMGEGVVAFSTTRQGGEGVGKYGQMNINPFCGDEAQTVCTNRQLLADQLKIAPAHIVLPHQTHGTTCLAVDDSLLGMSDDERKLQMEGVDCVMTDVRGLCIGVSTADCIPVLLYDADHHAVGAVHAGWRGTVACIARKAVGEMAHHYGSRPERLKAVIGPGISLKHFEVGQEVYDYFQDAGFPMDGIARRYAKWHIDLPQCNVMQLEEAGVLLSNIYRSGICTYEHSDRFFSARRLGAQSGRIYNGILMKGGK